MLYHPVYSGLGLNLFAEKYFEHCQYGWGCLHCTQNIFQQINASQDLNTQGDREFRALSEYIITFLKIYVLYWRYNSTDPNVQNLFTKGILSILHFRIFWDFLGFLWFFVIFWGLCDFFVIFWDFCDFLGFSDFLGIFLGFKFAFSPLETTLITDKAHRRLVNRKIRDNTGHAMQKLLESVEIGRSSTRIIPCGK
jgi:hypothetical protein